MADRHGAGQPPHDDDRDLPDRDPRRQRDDVLTVSEVAELLRVSQRMVQMLAGSGELPAFRVGKYWRFKRDRLDAYMEGAACPSTCTGDPARVPVSSTSNTEIKTASRYDALLAPQTRKKRTS
jgi:excisionase family DNA binding protein